jgi:hypothetical protein
MSVDDAQVDDPVEEAERARFAAVQALKARLTVEEEAERSRLRADEAVEAQRAAEEQAEKAALAAKDAEQARLTAEEEAERARLAAEDALQTWRTKLAAEEAERSKREKTPHVEAAAEGHEAAAPAPAADLEDTLDEQVSERVAETSAEHEESSPEADPLEAAEREPLLRPPLEDEPPVVAGRYLTCVISYWRGYRKAAFYARAFDEDGHELVLTESAEFKARGNGLRDPTEQAVAAHEELVAQLRRDGWEPVDRDNTWFGQTFRRRVPAAAEQRIGAYGLRGTGAGSGSSSSVT